MDIGSELRDARERRRLSIDDLSRRLKIKPSILNAIDENDAAHLPGGIFTRAFVKQYAREVGLDPADVVQRYEAQFAPAPVALPIAGVTSIEIDDDVHDEERTLDSLRVTDVRLLAVAAALVLIVVSYIAFNRTRVDTPPAPARAATNDKVSERAASIVYRPAAPQPQPVGTSGAVHPATSAAAPTTAPASAAPRALQVELRPRHLCWITATADGKRAAFRLMAGGERVMLKASNELVLRVGDAATLDYSVNGSRGRTLGGRAEVVTIRLTPANYREFIAR